MSDSHQSGAADPGFMERVVEGFKDGARGILCPVFTCSADPASPAAARLQAPQHGAAPAVRSLTVETEAFYISSARSYDDVSAERWWWQRGLPIEGRHSGTGKITITDSDGNRTERTIRVSAEATADGPRIDASGNRFYSIVPQTISVVEPDGSETVIYDRNTTSDGRPRIYATSAGHESGHPRLAIGDTHGLGGAHNVAIASDSHTRLAELIAQAMEAKQPPPENAVRIASPQFSP